MRFGLFSVVAAAAVLSSRENMRVHGVHLSHHHHHSDMDAGNLAQLNSESQSKVNSLRNQILAARTHLHEVQESRGELQNLRETYAKGRDDYSSIVSQFQNKIDAYDADLADCTQRINNRDALIGAYRKQIGAAEAQIREIESGGTIHIQVPVIKSSEKECAMPKIQPRVSEITMSPAKSPASA